MRSLLEGWFIFTMKQKCPALGRCEEMLIPAEGTIQIKLTQGNFLTGQSRRMPATDCFRSICLWGRKCSDSYNLLSRLFKSQTLPGIYFNNPLLLSCIFLRFLPSLWRIFFSKSIQLVLSFLISVFSIQSTSNLFCPQFTKNQCSC